MAKLTRIEKELARNFKKEIAEKGGEIFYDPLDSGMAVAILPHDSMKPVGFVEVYVTYCSPNDEFSKKRARLVLQDRVYHGNHILFPCRSFGYQRTYQDIADWFFNAR